MGFSVVEIREVSDRLKQVIKTWLPSRVRSLPWPRGPCKTKERWTFSQQKTGGNCVFMGEKGCYYGNESGLAETDSNHFTSCWKNSTNTTRHLSFLFLLAVCTLHMGSPVLRAGNIFFLLANTLPFLLSPGTDSQRFYLRVNQMLLHSHLPLSKEERLTIPTPSPPPNAAPPPATGSSGV